jgi:hypothetical protein
MTTMEKFMISLLTRARAAIAAFRDPALVGEAKSMRETVQRLDLYQEFALLSAMWIGDYQCPKISMLPMEAQQAIRRNLYIP